MSTSSGKVWFVTRDGGQLLHMAGESDSRTYSIELEECHENDVPEMLDRFKVGDEVNFAELEEMGWRGEVTKSARSKACSTLL